MCFGIPSYHQMEGLSPSKHDSTAGADDHEVAQNKDDVASLRQQLEESQKKLKDREEQLAAAKLKIQRYEDRLKVTAGSEPIHLNDDVASASVCVSLLYGSFHIDFGIVHFTCFLCTD